MSVVTVVAEDKQVIIDGDSENFDLGLDANIWAIQWDGAEGHIEYKDNTPNKEIVDFSEYEYLASKHKEHKIIRDEEEVKKLAEDEANKNYKVKRKEMYNDLEQFEMIYDDKISGENTWVEAIQAIKLQFPKP